MQTLRPLLCWLWMPCVITISTITSGDEPKRIEQKDRIRAIRESFSEGAGAPGINWTDRQETALALIAIIDAESQPNGSWAVKSAAIARLELFGDMSSVVTVLLREMSFKHQELKGSLHTPLDSYPAARALSRLSVSSREPIIGSVWSREMSDHDITLRAQILLALDQESEVTVFRLRRIVENCHLPEEQRKVFVPPDSELRQTGEKNLERMVALLKDPDFRYRKIPDQTASLAADKLLLDNK